LHRTHSGRVLKRALLKLETQAATVLHLSTKFAECNFSEWISVKGRQLEKVLCSMHFASSACKLYEGERGV